MKLFVIFIIPALLAALLAFPAWPGSFWPYLLFNSGMLLMAALVFAAPLSYAYGFFSAFLFLGFWVKLILHLLAGITLIEPTGLFDWAPGMWDSTARAVAAAAFGVAIARALQLALVHGRGKQPQSWKLVAPHFYVRFRRGLWVLSVAAVVVLSFVNFYAAFYQIGVNPRIVLPFKLNIPIAWLITWGLALGVACLVHWEMRLHPRRGISVLSVAFLEAAATGISSISRFSGLFHSFAFLVAWFDARKLFGAKPGKKELLSLLVFFILVNVFILAAVQVIRIDIYIPVSQKEVERVLDQQPAEENRRSFIDGHIQQYMDDKVRQLQIMLFSRWVGLEAIMAVAAHPDKGRKLLIDALLEDPKRGVDSIYQKIAHASYGKSEEFTFLTLATAPAVLYYSGSLIVVLGGMIFLAFLLLVTERIVCQTIGNPFVASLAGVAMAYNVVQMTFPYLTAIFFLQLWSTLAVIALMERLGSGKE
jgi:hypothetical protein